MTAGLLSAAAVPVLYAAAMVVDALAAVARGLAYDRYGPGVLVVLPVIAAVVPTLAFSGTVALAMVGTLAWGVALGVRRSGRAGASRNGVRRLRCGPRVAAAAGGALSGGLYEVSEPLLVLVTAVVQALALVVLAVTRRHAREMRRAAAR